VGIQASTKEAPSFAFEGTSFATTSEEFKDAHEYAPYWVGHEYQPSQFTIGKETVQKVGVEQYLIRPKAATILDVSFYKHHLYWMRVCYNADDMKRIGGLDALRERLVLKYGSFTDASSGTWRLGNTHIQLAEHVKNDIVILDVADLDVYTQMQAAKAQSSDTGVLIHD
jgi:hypothetical protein